MDAVIEFLKWLIAGYAQFLLWTFAILIGSIAVAASVIGFAGWRMSVDRKELEHLRARNRRVRAQFEHDIAEKIRNGLKP